MRSVLCSMCIALAIGTISATPQATALEVFGNPGGLGDNAGSLGDYVALAQGFSVTGTSYTLDSIALGLQFTATLPTSSQISIGLYSDSGSNPGTLLGSFDTTTASPEFVADDQNVFSFSSYTGNNALNAGSSYWLVVSATSGAPVFRWKYAAGNTPPSEQSSSGVTYVGARGIDSQFPGDGWVDVTEFESPMRISVFATPVPEPSTYAMATFGVMALGVVARRRQGKSSVKV